MRASGHSYTDCHVLWLPHVQKWQSGVLPARLSALARFQSALKRETSNPRFGEFATNALQAQFAEKLLIKSD